MSRRWMLVLALCLEGCQPTWVRPYQLDFQTLNDNNSLLTIEGRTSLPSQAPLEAILTDSYGRRFGRSETVVTPEGTFSMILDISRAPGDKALSLEVHYDPQRAPVHVLAKTGTHGEAMSGPQVELFADRNLLVKRLSLMLDMNERQAALRQTEGGEMGIHELEGYVEHHPDDAQALLMLAVATLKARPAERHAGSKAHSLLERGVRLQGANEELTLEAKLWLSRLESEDKARRAERARAKKADPAERLRGNRKIVPGESLGEIRLGLPMRLLSRRYALDHYDFKTGEEELTETFVLKGAFKVEVEVEKANLKVASITTRSEFFQMEGGLGVGSLLQQAEEKFSLQLPVNFGPEEKRNDGNLYAEGEVELTGLTLIVERRTNPAFPVPVDTIVGMKVTPQE